MKNIKNGRNIKALLVLCFFLSINTWGQTGINTKNPNASSVLEIQSSNKGVLIPRVTLTSNTDNTTIPNPAESLLVYNSGLDSNFNIPGYMYWNVDSWVILSPTKTGKAIIKDGLVKDSQRLLSNSYSATIIDDILTVVYSGGNGVYYPSGAKYLASGSVGGSKEVYLELQAGKLESTGTLFYKITGKPGASVSAGSIKDLKIKFQDQLLGNIEVGGKTKTEALQYTLKNSVKIEDGNEFGANGSILTWYRNNVDFDKYIELPDDGAYVFSFRLYGVTASTYTAVQQQWFFISGWKEQADTSAGSTSVLADISEMGLISPRKGASITYTINLTVSGMKGDRVFFKMARGHNNGSDQKFDFTLKNGSTNSTPNEANGARTSMFYFKL